MIKSLFNKLTKRISNIIDKIKHKEPWYKYYGNNPRHLKYPDLTIYELVKETAESYPFNMAFSYYGREITYKEFINEVKKIASALLEIGVSEGDIVTICMPNTPTAICMFYAINMVGAVASMIHPLSSENEIELYLTNSKSKYIMILDMVYDKLLKVLDKTNVEHIIVSSVSDDMTDGKRALYWFFKGRRIHLEQNNKAIIFRDFLKKSIYYKEVVPAYREKNDDAVILYSGGTTGNPKGIVLTNRNFNALAMQSHIMADPSKAGDSILSIMPIFHGFGLGVCIHTPLYIGMKCILVPDFTPKKFSSLIKKYKPTFIAGVPTLYEALLKNNFSKNGLSAVKVVISGGDTLSEDLKQRLDQFLKEHGSTAEVRGGYGLTECTGACCLTPTKFYRPNIIGMPFPDMTFKIVKIDTTDKAELNEDGEICINGPTVMKGYLNNPEETKTTLVKHADGKTWLHTGDIGYMDEEGFVYFKQRLKRLIISSGYNIYPSYVEEIISKCPLVETSVVVGIPHPYKKQVVKAYIVLKEGEKPSTITKRKIKKYCESNLAKYSWPYEYEFRDALPTTKVGKVAYKEL